MRKPQRIQTGFDIFENGQPRKESKGLEHDGDTLRRPAQRLLAIKDLSLGRLYQAAGDAQ